MRKESCFDSADQFVKLSHFQPCYFAKQLSLERLGVGRGLPTCLHDMLPNLRSQTNDQPVFFSSVLGKFACEPMVS